MSATQYCPSLNLVNTEQALRANNDNGPSMQHVDKMSPKSPYADTDIISLDVGESRFRVHRSILSQSAILDGNPTLRLWNEERINTITLPDLEETTAHTLVHYLYTGTYQDTYHTLENTDPLSPFRLSISVYAVAIRTKLPGLAKLAREQVTALGVSLSIYDILTVARENAFPLLAPDETWLPLYIEEIVKKAAAEEPGLFTKAAFTDQIEGNRRFRQVVMQAIVNTYAGDSAKGSPMTVPQPPTMEDGFGKAHASLPGGNESGTGNVIISKGPEAVRETTETPPLVRAASLTLDEIDPTLRKIDAPEPFTDELGFEKSKTWQNMGKDPSAASFAHEKTHTRTDSVVQSEVSRSPTSPTEKPSPTAFESADTVSAAANSTNGDVGATKKSKNKNKKKKGKALGLATSS
ncbi:hypothetical protein CC80DRAFT_275299 [Byssothecium circinans]|uniref:BTB domain-containing protein n=1 Tax=Byssothecium circinans TaxID=147558 RepID=A0A6A5T9L6_9PLEO|nr:hypothetical protein CC80DRAFT_275299 [Byssothecium circinans]